MPLTTMLRTRRREDEIPGESGGHRLVLVLGACPGPAESDVHRAPAYGDGIPRAYRPQPGDGPRDHRFSGHGERQTIHPIRTEHLVSRNGAAVSCCACLWTSLHRVSLTRIPEYPYRRSRRVRLDGRIHVPRTTPESRVVSEPSSTTVWKSINSSPTSAMRRAPNRSVRLTGPKDGSSL